jgi:hypothetical protein
MENQNFKTPEPPVKGSVAIQKDSGNIPNEAGFVGVYHAKECEPTKLGQELWYILQENWKCLSNFASNLLQYGYWDDYINDGICRYCGKHDVGHCNSATGSLMVELGAGKIAPDPLSLNHTHVPSNPIVLSENAEQDGLYLQWVYVVDPKRYTMEIFRSVRKRGTCISVIKGKKHRQNAYQYFPVGIFSLHDSMPDWEEVEQRGLDFSKFYHNKYHQTPKKLVL